MGKLTKNHISEIYQNIAMKISIFKQYTFFLVYHRKPIFSSMTPKSTSCSILKAILEEKKPDKTKIFHTSFHVVKQMTAF